MSIKLKYNNKISFEMGIGEGKNGEKMGKIKGRKLRVFSQNGVWRLAKNRRIRYNNKERVFMRGKKK